MGRLLMFALGVLVGIFTGRYLQKPEGREHARVLFKRVVKEAVGLGKQIQELQEELREEIEDAASEAGQEIEADEGSN